ncbi:cell cycle checkpoint control protein RAD9A [Ceratina calcarata]|uniref:Cell cycle checkpoint control protein n=1 Tax=Ceratina calcarata TaxID=156304 RepID=A0AAJ7N7K2_9HYME|nr:cell cycle checkpoint control protein RAD9A [Ceratina calcarata]
MKCVIPSINVKVLAKAVHTLAKIGDEMYIEPQENNVAFRTVNMANSAYADFVFFENFFAHYAYGDLQESDALKCKISMRSAMAVFKSINVIDKQVETCHIKLEPNASEIIFILKYKNSIIKTHLLPILDCEILQTGYDKDSASNKLSFQAQVFGDAIQNFHQQLVEITLEVAAQKLLLRNYVDDTTGLSNTTRTQLVLAKGEFNRYDVSSETAITFCMKEFKSILSFAETVGASVSIYFGAAGRPAIFALKHPSFETNLVLSTLNPDADTQTETILMNKQDKSVRTATGNRRGSRKSNTKSALRMKNRSATLNCVSNPARSSLHPCFMEEENQKEQDDSNERSNPSTSRNNNQNVIEKSYLLAKNTHEKSQRDSRAESDKSTRLREISANEKRLVSSVFSNIIKRKSNNHEPYNEQNVSNDKRNVVEEDKVPNSPPPPAKKARLIFQKCFQRTFDPSTLPGYDVILADDSDEACSE